MPPFLEQSERARVFGQHADEYQPSQVLRLPGATPEQLERWVAQVWPGGLAALRPGDVTSPDLTATKVDCTLLLDERWLSLWASAHVGTFFHEVARRAADDGVPALVEERDSFYGRAPFLAMTAYFPGKPAELRYFDPLRPEVASRPIPESWVERFCGTASPVEKYALAVGFYRGKMLKTLALLRSGKVAKQPTWLSLEAAHAERVQQFEAEPLVAEPVPAPRVVAPPVYETVEPMKPFVRPQLPEHVLEGMGYVSGLLTLVMLLPLAVGIPVLAASLIKPTSLETWASAIVGSWVLVGWLGFIPLKWPSGGRIALPLRLAWFLGVPALVIAVMGAT